MKSVPDLREYQLSKLTSCICNLQTRLKKSQENSVYEVKNMRKLKDFMRVTRVNNIII